MRDMLDPASDYVFDSVGTVISKKGGVVERQPRTDEDWEKIRIGAVTLAEGVYLLKIPRPFAPPGDENNSTGPDPARSTRVRTPPTSTCRSSWSTVASSAQMPMCGSLTGCPP